MDSKAIDLSSLKIHNTNGRFQPEKSAKLISNGSRISHPLVMWYAFMNRWQSDRFITSCSWSNNNNVKRNIVVWQLHLMRFKIITSNKYENARNVVSEMYEIRHAWRLFQSVNYAMSGRVSQWVGCCAVYSMEFFMHISTGTITHEPLDKHINSIHAISMHAQSSIANQSIVLRVT